MTSSAVARPIVVSLASLLVALASIVWAGCPAPTRTLIVRVQTGLRAGYEVRHLEARLHAGAVSCRDVTAPAAQAGRVIAAGDQAALVGGTMTVGSFGSLAEGTYTVRVLARRPPVDPRAAPDEGEVLVSRCVVVVVTSDRVVRVPLTSDCLAVTCPAPGGSPEYDQCLNGRCVDPRCDPDEPSTASYCCDRALLGDACDADPTLCAAGSDCAPGASCVGAPRCEDGVCVEPAGDDCPAGQYCARTEDRCVAEVPLPDPPDAGTLDAAALDAGSDPDAPGVDAGASLDADLGEDAPASHDAFVPPDAWLPTLPSLPLRRTEVGTVEITDMDILPGSSSVFLAGRYPVGSYTLGGMPYSATMPGGFVWSDDGSTRRTFNLSGLRAPEDGPELAVLPGGAVVVGATDDYVQAPTCGTIFSDMQDAYAFELTSAGCRWGTISGNGGDEAAVDVVLLLSRALVAVRATRGAWGRAFPQGAVLAMRQGSSFAIEAVYEVPFQPWAIALAGTKLYVVGDGGSVAAFDLEAGTTAPVWTTTVSYAGATSTALRGVWVDDTGIYAVGTVSGAPDLGGDTDAWVVSLDVDGSERWQRTFGGARADGAVAVRRDATRGDLFVGGYVTGPTTRGFSSAGGVDQEAILVRYTSTGGEPMGLARLSDHHVVAIGEIDRDLVVAMRTTLQRLTL